MKKKFGNIKNSNPNFYRFSVQTKYACANCMDRCRCLKKDVDLHMGLTTNNRKDFSTITTKVGKSFR